MEMKSREGRRSRKERSRKKEKGGKEKQYGIEGYEEEKNKEDGGSME